MAHFIWSDNKDKTLGTFGNPLDLESVNWRSQADLVQLNLCRHSLSALPLEIQHLRKLQYLHACDNEIEQLPEFVGELAELVSLDLEDNRLKSIPDIFSRMPHLRELALSNNQIEYLPESISKLSGLTHLSLRNNNLRELPWWIGELTNLKYLALSGNKLASLPSELCQLRKLESLDLSMNELKALPDGIGTLRELKFLEIDDNRIRVLPKDFVDLQNLVRLEAARNSIESLPAEGFEKLNALEILNLAGNEVTALPKSARRLTKLRDVTLSENLPEVCLIENLTNEWDVFISHASEDKEAVAIPLCELLRRAGLRVWLDAREIRLGDSIRSRIDEGLSRSRFGIVVLSPYFLSKHWTSSELDQRFRSSNHIRPPCRAYRPRCERRAPD